MIDPGNPSAAANTDGVTLASMSPSPLRSTLTEPMGTRYIELLDELRLLPASRAAPAVSALLKLRRDSNWWVRKSVAEALGVMGSQAISAVQQLRRMARDRDSDVREEALVALSSIVADSVVPRDVVGRFIRGLADRDVAVQTRATALLGALPPSSARTVLPRLARYTRRRQRAWLSRSLVVILWPTPRWPGITLLIVTQIIVLLHNWGVSDAQLAGLFGLPYHNDIAMMLAFVRDHAIWFSLITVFGAILLLVAIRGIARFWVAMRRFYKADFAVRTLQSLVVSMEDAETEESCLVRRVPYLATIRCRAMRFDIFDIRLLKMAEHFKQCAEAPFHQRLPTYFFPERQTLLDQACFERG